MTSTFWKWKTISISFENQILPHFYKSKNGRCPPKLKTTMHPKTNKKAFRIFLGHKQILHSAFMTKSPVHWLLLTNKPPIRNRNTLFCTGMKFRQFRILKFLSQPRLTLFSTTTLARGGWLNSALLFSSWMPDLLKILTASFFVCWIF